MAKIIKGIAIAAAIVYTGGAIIGAMGTMGAAAGGLAAVTGTLTVTAGTAAATIATITNALAISAVLGGISSQLVGKPKVPRPFQNVEYSGTVEGRRIIYGEMEVSGMNAIPPMTSGTTNQFLHQVLVLAGHECNNLGQIQFNNENIGAISAITGNDDDGKVTSGAYINKAWVRKYVGTDTQGVDYKLNTAFPTQWDSYHRGTSLAYLALTFEFDETVYKNGKPEVTCQVQGKKVYDPRLDSTQTTLGGSGAQRIALPSTWTYSSNPALCLADYILNVRLGLGESSARMDWDLVATAANICDELVTVPLIDGSGTTTQKRYTCNTVLMATDRFDANLEVLVTSMLGVCYYSAGKWRMFAGAWSASAFTITDDDLIEGGVDVTTAYAYNERYNAVRGKFIDKDRNYQLMDFPPVTPAAYLAEDGEQAFKEVEWPSCVDVFEAQRAAWIVARKSRNRRSATLRCGMSAYTIRPFETGTVTINEIGWANKTVRCESWRFDPAGFIEIQVREEAATDWANPALSDYIIPTIPGTLNSTAYTPGKPNNLTVQGITSGINFSWQPPSVQTTGTLYQLFEHTASTPFSSAVKIWEGNSTSAFITKTDTTTRYYWVRLTSFAGVASTTEPATAGVAGAAGSISTVLNGVVSPSSVSVSGTAATLVTSSATVTATGGTSPYTYAWTRLSGSTLITATTPSAATTTFTGATLTSGTTVTAVFRCTITDNVAATKTVDVNVSIERLAMSVSVSPGSLNKTGIATTQTTASTTATPTGGVSPYTYAWSLVSGDALTVNSPTAATTTFTATGMANGDTLTAVYKCTVTDSTSPTALTAFGSVSVTISRNDTA
ncbi:Tip attachment protein J [uncultured Caudovirales phage]|uniref:Tip attachment protein J n=1 Tax=uncultured Caudovirales phage TaxID=2100421 RepID=A0A6J5N3G3_9CAUD|nr:Tip attachment protein J [uncultured Caudovirales phage]